MHLRQQHNPSHSKTSLMNGHRTLPFKVDVERSSDGNIDGLGMDGSVKVTVDAIARLSPIDAKEQQKSEI